MQVPSIFRPSPMVFPPLHQWPRPLKRVMLTVAAVICLAIYILLIVGVIGFLAVIFDFAKLAL